MKTNPAAELPSALLQLKEITADPRKQLAVFLDYDGTLTPIVSRPELAVLSGESRQVVRKLARTCTVAVISGRDLPDVRRHVGLEDIVYAGSHGFDIAGPGGINAEFQAGAEFLPELDGAERELRQNLAQIEGTLVERKQFSIAVHFRLTPEEQIPQVDSTVDQVLARHPKLRKNFGKKVFELQPKLDWHKGKALAWLLKTLGLDLENTIPLYIGDDLTDEDAFREIQPYGIPIVVREEPRPTLARYALDNPAEVIEFLQKLTDKLSAQSRKAWSLVYDHFDPGQEGLREALCTLGNGYFATRGAAPETEADEIHYPGAYLAGGYNRLRTEIAGRTVENEDLVNLPNWLPLTFRIEGGNWFNLMAVDLLEYHQELDLKAGLLLRHLRFRDKQGRISQVRTRRLVHMKEPHLAALEMVVIPENWSGTIEVRSGLDGQVINAGVERYRNLNDKHLEPVETSVVDEDRIYLKVETNQSEIRIAQTARTRFWVNGQRIEASGKVAQEPGCISQYFTLELKAKEELRVEKVLALFTSRDFAIADCGLESRELAGRAGSFEELLESHLLAWEHLWGRFDIEIDMAAPSRLEHSAMVLHLHIFHLLQTTSMHTIDLDVGVPSRGWHGEAYRGHIFWDELFIFPLLNLRMPEITRALLIYRYHRLNQARLAASEAGYKGAMFPWQSGSNGREETQVLHLNPKSGRWIPDHSRLQRHVNVAIAYNIWQYFQVTRDIEFLQFHGAEMFLEITRFLASLATWNREEERYEILGVMGPDEYHDGYPNSEQQGLDNNAYTNVMAAWTFAHALEMLDLLPPDRRQELCELLHLQPGEWQCWEEISRKMKVPFHGDGIISQFEGYERLEEFPWDEYRTKYGDIQRLDRVLEAEGDTVNRYKASKQADVLMLFYLFSFEELRQLFERLGYPFHPTQIESNIHYYLARTSHGSTLSRVVHSWVLARADRPKSWELFKTALESDLKDIQGGTTPEGIHVGAMAGTVDLVQRCYTGLEMREDVLWFDPRLPEEVSRLIMELRYRGQSLHLELTQEALKISARKCPRRPIKVGFQKEVFQLEEGQSRTFQMNKTKPANSLAQEDRT
jgi:alpha,alpha-trehalase